MEFETAFFFDVDGYLKEELAISDKLIYVGTSRATYYLGITLIKDFPESLNPVKNLFSSGTSSKDIDSDY